MLDIQDLQEAEKAPQEGILGHLKGGEIRLTGLQHERGDPRDLHQGKEDPLVLIMTIPEV